MSTLHMAIAAATTTVPASTANGPSTTRRTMATVSTASAAPTTRLLPHRLDSTGARMPASPKHTVGTAVITLAQVLVAPNESRTSPSTEPRLVMAGRMFAAASATPASRSPPAAAAAGCELGGAPPAGGVAGLLAV